MLPENSTFDVVFPLKGLIIQIFLIFLYGLILLYNLYLLFRVMLVKVNCRNIRAIYILKFLSTTLLSIVIKLSVEQISEVFYCH